MKYALKLTRGDDVKILAVYDDKSASMAAGAEYRKTISIDEGLLGLIEADFDEYNKMIGVAYKLHEIFP